MMEIVTMRIVFVALALCACATRPSLSESSLELARVAAGIGKAVYIAEGEQKFTEKGLDVARNSLRDPSSAQFRNIRVVAFGDGNLLCGEVNGKNGFGGYVGFTPFYSNGVDVVHWKDEKYKSSEREINNGLIVACSHGVS